MEKDFASKSKGHRQSCVFIFFPEIFCQRIDRKSQEVSTTYVKPLGFNRRRKKVWVNLTPSRA